MSETLVFSEEKSPELSSQITEVLTTFLSSSDNLIFLPCPQLENTPYMLKAFKINSQEPLCDITFEIVYRDTGNSIAFPCYLTYMVAEEGNELHGFGYYQNGSPDKLKGIATLLGLYDDALSQALANKYLKEVKRSVNTNKSAILEQMVKRQFVPEGVSGTFITFSKVFKPINQP